MPTLNLGQVRPVYRGVWNSIDTYSAYDFVIYNGSAYLALKDVPANYEPPSQTEYWVLFGAKGEHGKPGVDGVDGAQGERGPSPAYRWDGTFLSIQNPDGTFPDQGVDLQGPPVPLSNSVASTSETDAASSLAAKTAYDRGSAGIAAADGLRQDVPGMAATAAGPSKKTIQISLTGTSTEYLAPEAGYISYRAEPQDNNAWISLAIDGTSLYDLARPIVAGSVIALSLPVSKRQKAILNCASNVSFTSRTARFIYANGNAPA